MRKQELCRLCAIWQRKVRSLPRGNDDDCWGPSDEELQSSSVSEVTGSWIEESSSDQEVSDQNDNDSDASDNADWEDVDDHESDGELIESLEAVAIADEYRADDSHDVLYTLPDLSSQSLQHRSSVSPTKRSRNT
jgi:hypothetical protein